MKAFIIAIGLLFSICVGNWCYLEGPVESAQIRGPQVQNRTYHLRVYDPQGDVYEMRGSYRWWDQSYQNGTARGIGRRVQ